jgi:ferredoxin--NADP+ reductase
VTTLRVAVVGSGPAGAYVAQALCDGPYGQDVSVDVFEQLPVPYGLVRCGVAPDHERIKSIANSLASIFERGQVRFVGNVRVGTDVVLEDLRRHYDAVVIAAGVEADRALGIPGESLAGVRSAREFVAWYNGHPDSGIDAFALRAEDAVIVGLGNVALDVARMLCRTPDELRRTDVPEHVIGVLAESTIRSITVIGRGRAVDARFTNKELAELRRLSDTEIVVDPAELPDLDAALPNALSERLMATVRGYVDEPVHGSRRRLRFAFGRTPLEVVGEEAVTGLRAGRRISSDPAAAEEVLPAQFLVRSIGYRGEPFPGLPFDEDLATIPNRNGRVSGLSASGGAVYVAGWIKRGPSGVIGTNKRCAADTVASLIADQQRDEQQRPGRLVDDDLVAQLRVRHPGVVDWDGWTRIDSAESVAGWSIGRDRVKFHDRDSMLAAAAP